MDKLEQEMTDQTCENCRYWDSYEWDKDYKEGYCHRHAPIAGYADTEIHAIKKAVCVLLWWYVREHEGDPEKQLSDYHLDPEDGWHCTCWPHTSEDDWCGEWKQRTEEQKAEDRRMRDEKKAKAA
jgi:hypothetical protein